MTLSIIMAVAVLGIISVSENLANAATHAPIDIQQDSDFTTANGVVSGNGSATNPYVISDWEIRDNGTCISIGHATKAFIITNVTIYSPASGEKTAIYLEYVTRGPSVLDNITIHGPDRNLVVSRCSDVTFRNITMGNSSILGVYECSDLLFIDVDMTRDTGRIECSESQDCRFVRCRTAGTGSGSSDLEGIKFADCNNMDLYRCNSSGHWTGLSIIRGNGCDVVDCDFWDNAEIDVSLATIGTNSHRLNSTRMGPRGLLAGGPDIHDIDLSNRVNGKVLHYHVDETGGVIDGDAGQVYLFGCDNFTVLNLSMEGPYCAIRAYDCKNLTISNTTASSLKYCFWVTYVPDLTISDCHLTGLPSALNSDVGVYATGCANLTVVDTVFSAVWRGIESKGTSSVPSRTVVRDVVFREVYIGVHLTKVNESLVETCVFVDCYQCIIVSDTISTRIANNTMDASGRCGITISTTGHTEIVGNVISGVEYGMDVLGAEVLIVGNQVSDCSYAGLNSRGGPMHIADNTWTNCTNGLLLDNIDTLLINDTVRGSTIGVRHWGTSSRNVTMRDCSVLDSSEYGVYIESQDKELIKCIIDNAPTGIYIGGVLAQSYIVECVISNCTVGIDLQGGSSRINASLIRDCTSYGIRAEGPGCRVYWNTFLRTNYNSTTGAYNGPQATCDSTTTFWSEDNEGNYWADYELRYPDAKVVNLKFWDTPYQLEPTSRLDRFPLAIPVDLVPPVAVAGSNATVPQGTRVLLDGSGSTDDVGIVMHEWVFLYGGLERRIGGMTTNFTFDRPGIYEVTLTVWDLWGNSASDTIYITVLDTEPPAVDTGGDLVVDQGEVFNLDATGSTDNVDIVSYRWTVDPGGLNLTFDRAYATLSIDEVGVYVAILNVSDLTGNWAIGTINITVNDIERPVADAGEDLEVDQGTNVTFDGTGSTDNQWIAGMTWSFRHGIDTIDLEGDRPSFTFDVPGTYEVTLKVTDAVGLTDMDTLTVVVRDTEPPVTRAGADVTVEPGTLVSLDGSDSTDNVGIVSWSWRFTYDGLPTEFTTSSFAFKFDIEGRYVINLTLEDARGNQASDEVVVLVQDTIPPVAVAGGDITIDQHQTATFDGSMSTDERGLIGWLWTFADGGAVVSLRGVRPSHVFDEAGTYLVTLTVTDGAGNSAVDTLQVIVLDTTPPEADAGPDRTVNQSERCVLDGGLSADNVGIAAYSWTFVYMGDVTYLEGRTVEFTFGLPGMYNVTLRVVDQAELSSTDEMFLTVRDTMPPVAAFSMDPDRLQARRGATYTFDGSGSTDNVGVVNWTWTVRLDGDVVATLHGAEAKYVLASEGRYGLNLTVRDARGNAASDGADIDVRDEGDGGPTGWTLGLALILVAVAAAAAGALLWWRRRAGG